MRAPAVALTENFFERLAASMAVIHGRRLALNRVNANIQYKVYRLSKKCRIHVFLKRSGLQARILPNCDAGFCICLSEQLLHRKH